jgi:5-methylcytosine-specific restriction endonuclease McrA
MDEWIDIQKNEHHVARERERARLLKKSAWWQQQLDAGICHYCHKKTDADELTLDHVVPIARGGCSNKGNVVAACRDCNQKKKYLTPAEQILADLEERGEL